MTDAIAAVVVHVVVCAGGSVCEGDNYYNLIAFVAHQIISIIYMHRFVASISEALGNNCVHKIHKDNYTKTFIKMLTQIPTAFAISNQHEENTFFSHFGGVCRMVDEGVGRVGVELSFSSELKQVRHDTAEKARGQLLSGGEHVGHKAKFIMMITLFIQIKCMQMK